MVKLTEQMVIARTKQSNLSLITKFNCCGASITDASILRHMSNITVLSLSVNNITSLEVFKWCPKLQELYVRRNNIKELNEVCYLQDLRSLKNFWLADNPCTKDFTEESYRLTVIKALPQVRKLDNQIVEENELGRALRHNTILIHPDTLKAKEYYEPDSEEVESGEGDVESEVLSSNEPQLDQKEELMRIKQEQNWQETSRGVPEGVPEQSRVTDPLHSNQERYYESGRHPNDRRYDIEPSNYSTDPGRQQIEYSSRGSPEAEPPEHQEWAPKNENEEPEDLEVPPPHNFREEVARESDVLTRSSSFKNDNPCNARGGHYGSMPRSRTADEFGYCRRNNQRPVMSNCSVNCNRRVTDRKPNVLNAILCLIKELDYQNLAVVEHAVKSRMDELEG